MSCIAALCCNVVQPLPAANESAPPSYEMSGRFMVTAHFLLSDVHWFTSGRDAESSPVVLPLKYGATPYTVGIVPLGLIVLSFSAAACASQGPFHAACPARTFTRRGEPAPNTASNASYMRTD